MGVRFNATSRFGERRIPVFLATPKTASLGLLLSRAAVVLDRRGKLLATVGQRKRLFGEPDFYCAQVNAECDIVAIRSPFQLHMLGLVPDATP